MKPPRRLFRRREPDRRWLEVLFETSLDVGMLVEAEDFKSWSAEKVRYWFAFMARCIARIVAEKAHREPGTYEYRGKDDDGTGFVLCTVEIAEGGRVFVTYPDDFLTIGFEREDLFNPEDN